LSPLRFPVILKNKKAKPVFTGLAFTTFVSCFIAKVEGKAVKLSEEYDHFKWAEPENVLSLLDFEEQKKLLGFVNKTFL